MIRFRLASIALATVLTVAALAQPYRLVFANTELSAVLRAVGLRSGANIVYVGTEDPGVTLNVTAGSTDEALKFITTAAGVTYRRVGNTYVVAAPENMKRALEPFGLRYRVELTNLKPRDAMTVLAAPLPYLTVQPAGTGVLLTGTRDDIDQAREILEQQEQVAVAVPAVTEIVPVRLVAADQAATVLSEMYPDVRFRTVAQDGVGSLIMTGPTESVAAARATLGMIDTRNPLPGAEEVFKVYEIRYSSAGPLIEFLSRAMPDIEAIVAPENYVPTQPTFRPLTGASITGVGSTGNTGTTGTTGAGGGASNLTGGGVAPGGILPAEQKSKRLVLRGARDRVDSAITLLTSLDIRPKQVMVEVKVVDYSPSKDSEVGFNWNWAPFNFYELAPGTPVTLDDVDQPIGNFRDFLTKPAGFGTFSRMPWSYQSILQAAIVSRDARILATPSVQVIDGEDANIFIGDTIRAQVSQTGALGGQTVEIVEFPIGIILLIRPRVNADGDITLRVHPVVSTITALDSNGIPQTSTREAETTLVVKDGETMVLGGLIRDEMSKVVREVPILSQLPLIGELFRSTSTTGRKSEILVFVTPRIVDLDADAQAKVQPQQEALPVPPAPEKKK